jgi:phosphoribosylaminoimidazole carboxylase PurK protein
MKKKLAIVGGGQLGRMLALAALPLGFDVAVLDPTENCPASVCATHVLGSFKDPEAIEAFVTPADYTTFEIESANAEAMTRLVTQGKCLNPLPTMLALIKDKFQQKFFYQQHGIPCAASTKVSNKADILKAAEQYGFPLLVKARFDAYDGRGNALVKSADDIDAALKKLATDKLYVEQFVPFEKELAVIVARDMQDNIKSYPVVETIHKNNICHTVLCPAPIDSKTQEKATEFAEKLVSHLQGAGVFAVELFLTKSGEVLVNETAPRVHNSGHHTIEACYTSQFEQHIRGVTNLPLGDTAMKVPAAVMVNILGERHGKSDVQGLDAALAIDGVNVHIYGKAETKLERKMGHITAIADTLDKALAKATQARELISV